MILNFKYHADSGLLEAYRSYTLAQNNSLSDTVVITSTAADASRYNYCLEFICYNSKSIPKAQYVSPILTYGSEGVTFTLPNNLTEFRGHVDMQLTGYDPDDNSIVFKSISKNCKAFDVEGSLCVLEKDLNETPNVFTEVFLQLEQLRSVHQDIIDEAMAQFAQKFFDKVESYKWYRVSYYLDGSLIDERLTLGGNKINPPKYVLPDRCVVVGDGWYDPTKGRLWDLEKDVIEGDTQLHLNFMSDDVVISEGVVTSLGNRYRADIYVPFCHDGYSVKSFSSSVYYAIPKECRLHLTSVAEDVDFEKLIMNEELCGIYMPGSDEGFTSIDGYLYGYHDGENLLVYAPKLENLRIDQSCTAINSYAINNNSKLRSIYFPESIQIFGSYCIVGTALEELVLPSSALAVNYFAVYNNPNLKRVYINSDLSGSLADETFMNQDMYGNITRPTLYVLPQHYARYKALNLSYDIRILGEEYFDERYAQKEA